MSSPNTDYTTFRQKPLLTVTEVQQILQLGRTATYEFLKTKPPFRVLHINHSIRVPSSDFFKWIDG